MRVVIFGGTGFIGTWFADFLLSHTDIGSIVLADIKGLEGRFISDRLKLALELGQVKIVKCDVRNAINLGCAFEKVDLIANFAAIHREPGHEVDEYYETNLLGAENICAWAESVGCKQIMFTSSIAPYGPTEKPKCEESIPAPVSAYGGSKLAAEKIHIAWQHKDIVGRHLVIVRPGVVFGPGEGGNVSRLIKAVIHRYFFYMGNKNTRKAGTYVKELCNAMLWVLRRQKETGERISIFNMSMNPGPSIEEYVQTCCKVAGIRRKILSVPYFFLLVVALIIELFAKPLGVKHPFSPVRIKKLVFSNNIIPNYLIDANYKYQYDLERAFYDWKQTCPDEWK